jgi:ribosomal protein S18 acetylase RimI-like enzyme
MSHSEWTVCLESDPNTDIREKILKPLAAYNEACAGPGHWEVLAITVRNHQGEVVGGLWGRIGYNFLNIELLALGPAKDSGLGRRVMAVAETEALKRKLAGVWLDTWSFQAPEFYRKLGFEECGRIEEYPPGHQRIFFVKRFPESRPTHA